MVEGHGVHRVAEAHKRRLLGKSFVASSPNGRFVDGAAAINEKPLLRIEAHGKNLFYFFGGATASDEGCVVVHIHFGMAGAFRLSSVGGAHPKPTTRLQLEGHGLVAQLSAMTLAFGPYNLYNEKLSKLGEDPLRTDSSPERIWAKMMAKI